ncbi:hypothetical protein BC828DRAFT_381647 [Blastocladiella britannica]|nr:hypothetical protein BC828DRAFT_381647 [Blastocladiella britannica]
MKSTILLIATVAAVASAQTISLPPVSLPTGGAIMCVQVIPKCPTTCPLPTFCAIKGRSATECARAECRLPNDINNGWSLAPGQATDGISFPSTPTATDASTATSTSSTASTAASTSTTSSVTPAASQTPSGADANKGGALVAAVVVGAAAFVAL